MIFHLDIPRYPGGCARSRHFELELELEFEYLDGQTISVDDDDDEISKVSNIRSRSTLQ